MAGENNTAVFMMNDGLVTAPIWLHGVKVQSAITETAAGTSRESVTS